MFRIVPQLTVADMERSIRFYEERLGFGVATLDPEEDPVFAELERGEQSLFLVSEQSREEGAVDRIRGGTRGAGVRLYLEVDDARSEYERLRAAGTEFRRDIAYNEAEDYTEFQLTDPDGYEIGIYS